jgi:hypothetical protein
MAEAGRFSKENPMSLARQVAEPAPSSGDLSGEAK